MPAQAQKAINIFAMTLGKNQRVKPELNLSIDEASAVHLTYIWSELRMLGQDPRLWFATMHQDRGQQQAEAEPRSRSRRPPRPPRRRRGRGPALPPARRRDAAAASEAEPFGDAANEIRIACIDIGGGTTDLMIAKLQLRVEDRRLHPRPGAAPGRHLAGRRPARQAAAGDDHRARLRRRPGPGRRGRAVALRARGAAQPRDPRAAGQLDEPPLRAAGPGLSEQRRRRRHRRADLAHRSRDRRSGGASSRCKRSFDKLRGPGYYNAQQELDLVFDQTEFEGVVYDVFDELLFDFCQRIVEHEADVVLLAGLPSKLGYIQQLVKMYVPLAAVADRAHAQPLRRQLVSVPGREGPQPGRDRRPEEPGGRRRGDRVHGPARHAAAVQVRHEGQAPARTRTTGA